MKSLSTALKVLNSFSHERSTWSVRDLSRQTGLNKSQLSKILREFRASGLLQQDPDSREYSVGLRAVALGSRYLNANRLPREAISLMRQLVDLSGHTATLCVMDDDEVMYLQAVEGPLFLDVGWRVGTWLPFHATAVGKVLAASLDEGELDRLISLKALPRYTPNTLCDPDELKAHLEGVRHEGAAYTHSEGTRGLAAQAVPVLGEQEEVIAALGFVYPAKAVDDTKRIEYTRLLHESARRLSEKLGARVYPYGYGES